MKKNNYVLTLTFILMATSLFAQDFQGKAIYKNKTSITLDLDSRAIPEEQKQRIRQRIKNATEQSYELTFDRISSRYFKEEKIETPTASGGGVRFAFAASGGSGDLYKNIQNQSYTNQTELFGKIFLIQDSLTNWEWKLGSETKKIGNYTVYKATTVQKNDSTSENRFRRFRPDGRGSGNGPRQEEAKKERTIQDSIGPNSLLARIDRPTKKIITAWYAPEIPVSQGPGNYWGLPGLILEVNDGQSAILCSKIVLNADEKIKIKEPTKGKKVNQKEYDKIVSEKIEEMSERFQGGKGRGNGNVIRIRG